MQVTIHQAKTQLSKLIAAVERGEEVIIARRDKPVVTLTPYVAKQTPKPSEGAGGLCGFLSEEALDYLTNNPELDRQLEEDFESFEEDWKE